MYYPITSDQIGNPLSDGTRTYTWKHGRQMATVTKDGITWTNTYNADGLRIKRASSTTTYTYVYNGSQLTQMTVGGNTLRFTYDAAGSPMLVTYNGTNYYYVTNLQGDVVAIVDANGNPVVRYEYDPWGALLSCTGSMASTLGVHNPLLYRAYVYDWETNLYYLQSRYYDPSLRRFINADSITSTGQGILGNNMFAYCLNNPVNCADDTGTRCVTALSRIHTGGKIAEQTDESWTSDGREKSNSLLEIMKKTCGDVSELPNFRCSVTYDGIVTKTTDTSLQWAMIVLDGALIFIPGTIPKIISVALLAHDVYKLAEGPDLPDKDYHHYTVSISWDQRFNVGEGVVIEHYSYDLIYLWDDTSYTSPSWYLLNVIDYTHTEPLFE